MTRLTACILVWLWIPMVQAETPDPLTLEVQDHWTGDLDGMIERHQIRFLVVYNPMLYFLDGPVQRGASYEFDRTFEKWLNKRLKTRHLRVEAVFVPVSRDQLIPALLDGRGDIATANLTITPERRKRVDFSIPLMTGVKEVVVSGPRSPRVETLQDLSGKLIYVRRSSSYYESLRTLNRRFEEEGRKPAVLALIDDHLEDADLLEMLNAGILSLLVVDLHKARFWADVLPHIQVHEDIAVREGGEIAWAFRKGSPKLAEAANAFIAKHRKGTFTGNLLFKRYLQKNRWVRNNLTEKELKKFKEVIEFFKKYGDLYGFDALMLAALAYQESGLDQSKRSPQGAVGIMQILPSTAHDPNIAIEHIERIENNIHAGVKYLRFLYDRYYADQPMDKLDKVLFTFASYNAGPARIRRLRAEAEKRGLDPNRWFRNVEVVAARRIGQETVRYVRNIYKYYIAYRLLDEHLRKRAAISAMTAQ